MQKYTCEKCWWKIEEPNTYPKNIFQWAIEAHKNNFCKNKKTREELEKDFENKFDNKSYEDFKQYIFNELITNILKDIIPRKLYILKWYDEAIKEIKQNAKDLYNITL